jgi:hypothetical protein
VSQLTSRVLTLLATLCLSLAFVVVAPTPASACSCQGLGRRTAAERADAIFTGRVLAKSTVRRPSPGRTDVRFAVSRVYKGSVYAEQVVGSPQGADGCGVDLAIGSTWVIFADEHVDGTGKSAVFRLVTGDCSGNIPETTAPSDLGAGREPIAGVSDREEKAILVDARFTRGLKVAGALLGALVLVVAGGLGVLWSARTRDA